MCVCEREGERQRQRGVYVCVCVCTEFWLPKPIFTAICSLYCTHPLIELQQSYR